MERGDSWFSTETCFYAWKVPRNQTGNLGCFQSRHRTGIFSDFFNSSKSPLKHKYSTEDLQVDIQERISIFRKCVWNSCPGETENCYCNLWIISKLMSIKDLYAMLRHLYLPECPPLLLPKEVKSRLISKLLWPQQSFSLIHGFSFPTSPSLLKTSLFTDSSLFTW